MENGLSAIFIGKLDSTGIIDNLFGNNGFVMNPIWDVQGIRDLTLQTDGKIVAQGYSGDNGNYPLLIMRLNSNGTFDNSFGNNGNVTANAGYTIESGYFNCRTLINPNGKLILVGETYSIYNPYIGNFEVMSLNNNGIIDTTACNQGFHTVDIDTANIDGSFDGA